MITYEEVKEDMTNLCGSASCNDACAKCPLNTSNASLVNAIYQDLKGENGKKVV